MPRKKLIRRFEPRYTVSQEMVDREAKYVHLEHADYLLGSIHDLREQLDKWQPLWRQVNELVESLIQQQGEREALAYRCMIIRDLYHILELYRTCMMKGLPEASVDAPVPVKPVRQERVEQENKIAPFSEWLFQSR
jgi:hypothetical protein